MKERETEVINIHVPQIERSSKYLLHGNTSQNKTTMLLEYSSAVCYEVKHTLSL